MANALSKIARLDRIERLLASHTGGLTRAEIARRVDVNRSTITRDVRELTGILPIYEEDDGRIVLDMDRYETKVRLNIHESMAVHMATRLMAARTDKHNPNASAALRKLGQALEGSAPFVSTHLLLSADVFDSESLRKDKDYLQALETLTRAWSQGLPLELDYRAGDGEPRHFTFEPYFIEPYAMGRTSYAIGRVREREALRTLKLERIEACRLLEGERYDVPADFDARAYLRSAWGIWISEGEPEEVRLRFGPDVAERVRETQWHASEEVTELKDGGLEWRATVSEWIEMLPWVRGWGAEVEVLAPPEMRAELRREAEALMGVYGG